MNGCLLKVAVLLSVLPWRVSASPLDAVFPVVGDLLGSIVTLESTDTKSSLGVGELFGFQLLHVETVTGDTSETTEVVLLGTPVATLLRTETQHDPQSPIKTAGTTVRLLDSPLAGLFRANFESLPPSLGQPETTRSEWKLLDPGMFNLMPLLGFKSVNSATELRMLFLFEP